MLLLVFSGAILFFGSTAWLLIRGMKDGAFPDTLLLLMGISVIAYVTTRWDRAKWPVILIVAGVVMMFVGIAWAEPL